MAIATGSAVAQGQSPVKVKLANRLDRKRLAVHLEEESGEVEVDQPERLGLAPSIHGGGSLSGDGLPSPLAVQGLMEDARAAPYSASQSVSVTRGNTNTEAVTVVMASYGAMMGQMANGMLEGVGPQLMQMLQNVQVIGLL